MIGYHFTSWRNWLKIQKQGIIPYDIDFNSNMLFSNASFKIDVVKGIWLWKNRQKGKSNFGIMLDRAVKLKTFKIVVLKVKYNQKDLLKINGIPVNTFHKGSIGNWVYHRKCQSVIVVKRIPPFRIEVLQIIGLENLALDNERLLRL